MEQICHWGGLFLIGNSLIGFAYGEFIIGSIVVMITGIIGVSIGSLTRRWRKRRRAIQSFTAAMEAHSLVPVLLGFAILEAILALGIKSMPPPKHHKDVDHGEPKTRTIHETP